MKVPQMVITCGLVSMILVACLSIPILADDNSFTPFVWSGSDLSGVHYSKAALLIPVKISGIEQQFYLQLDTGTRGSHLYGNVLSALNLNIDSEKTKDIQIAWYEADSSLGVYSFPVYWRRMVPVDTAASGVDSRIIGTIGTDILLDKILVIDFPRTHYAVFKDSIELPEKIGANVRYTPARIEYGMFYVSLILGDDTLKSVFYDTGASLTELLLPLEKWEKATGLDGADSTILKDSVSAWGKLLPIMRAPAQFDMHFGDIHIKSPMVVTAEWPNAAQPDYYLMGNAPFYEDYIVIVDFSNSRMGLMQSAEL